MMTGVARKKNIYGTILCMDKFRARLQLILLSAGKGDKG
jgi:hypothetical protein